MAAERYPYAAAESPVSLKKSIRIFTLTYLGLAVLLMLIFTVVEYEAPMAMAVIVLLGAAQYAGSLFYKDNRRLPEKGEKRRFGLYAMLVCMGIAILSLSVLFAFQDAEMMGIIQDVTPLGFCVAMLVNAALSYLISSWFFGQGAKFMAKGEAIKAKKDAADKK